MPSFFLNIDLEGTEGREGRLLFRAQGCCTWVWLLTGECGRGSLQQKRVGLWLEPVKFVWIGSGD